MCNGQWASDHTWLCFSPESRSLDQQWVRSLHTHTQRKQITTNTCHTSEGTLSGATHCIPAERSARNMQHSWPCFPHNRSCSVPAPCEWSLHFLCPLEHALRLRSHRGRFLRETTPTGRSCPGGAAKCGTLRCPCRTHIGRFSKSIPSPPKFACCHRSPADFPR